MKNSVAMAWKEGRPVVNGWLSIPSVFTAEVMARAGWDSLTVDMQHGLQDYASAVACFQGAQVHGATPLVRVPGLDPALIGKVLDAGARGVICPMINTAEQARTLVSACRYPPLGQRSFGPIRAGMFADPTDTDGANQGVLVMPMIETAEALENLDAILDVPGIDAIYVGPADLGLSLGFSPKLDREEPRMLEILAQLVEATRRRGIVAGLHVGSGAYAKRMFEIGYRFASIMSDSGLLTMAARAQIAMARD